MRAYVTLRLYFINEQIAQTNATRYDIVIGNLLYVLNWQL